MGMGFRYHLKWLEALSLLGLALACAPVDFNHHNESASSLSQVDLPVPGTPDGGTPPGPSATPVLPPDCAAAKISFTGSAKVTDERGYALFHDSCTPTMDFAKEFDIPILKDKAVHTVVAKIPGQTFLAQFDKLYCDRSYLAAGYEVRCDNGKLHLKSVEVKYDIGRTDYEIYLYRSSFKWKEGETACQMPTANFPAWSCHGNTASFNLTGMFVSFK